MVRSGLQELRATNPQDQDILTVLKNLMSLVQNMKAKLGANNQNDEQPIKGFVAKYFKEADDELRSGNAGPATIKKLLNASYLIDMTQVFGPLAQDSLQRSIVQL